MAVSSPIVVISLECDEATAMVFRSGTDGDLTEPAGDAIRKYSMRHAVSAAGGDIMAALVEYLSKIRHVVKEDLHQVVVVAPGVIHPDGGTLLTSSRLGLRKELHIRRHLQEEGYQDILVVHDIASIVQAERKYGAGVTYEHERAHCLDDFALVWVGEGIGSAIYSRGQLLSGAGSAGHLGRLIIDPQGPYSGVFNLRGALEVYTARQWLNSRLLEEWHAQRAKGKPTQQVWTDRLTRALDAAQSPLDIPLSLLANAVGESDGRSLKVIDQASYALGLALSHVIVTANPRAILLGGPLLEEIPRYRELTIERAKELTWHVPLANTIFLPCEMGERGKFLGGVDSFLAWKSNK